MVKFYATWWDYPLDGLLWDCNFISFCNIFPRGAFFFLFQFTIRFSIFDPRISSSLVAGSSYDYPPWGSIFVSFCFISSWRKRFLISIYWRFLFDFGNFLFPVTESFCDPLCDLIRVFLFRRKSFFISIFLGWSSFYNLWNFISSVAGSSCDPLWSPILVFFCYFPENFF